MVGSASGWFLCCGDHEEGGLQPNREGVMQGQGELFPKWNPHVSSWYKRVGRKGVKQAKAVLAEAVERHKEEPTTKEEAR